MNLSTTIEKQLPAELVNFMQLAAEVAAKQGQALYLVGGIVRDLLLEEPNFDLDLVVEGDAIDLARRLVQITQGKITTHPRFNTAKIQWNKWSVDMTTARSDIYAKPGALPKVKPGSLSSDLFRRDFTINAMAVHLGASHYAELIDLYGGRDDLEHKLIRILHEKSLIDDATRIWRGLRYEQRLNFRIEPTTLRLLKRDTPMLDTISGDRIRYELECILQEKYPEKVFRRAEELSVLPKLHPALKGNGWLTEKFEQSRQLFSPEPPPAGAYLALLTYLLTSEDIKQFISRLRLPKSQAQTLRDTNSIKSKLQSLTDRELAASHIYSFLHGYSSLAVTVSSLATDSPAFRQHIQLFLNKLRYVKPALSGKDLKRIGIEPGPRIKEMLNLLHMAKLDGKLTTKQDEVEMVKRLLNKVNQG